MAFFYTMKQNYVNVPLRCGLMLVLCLSLLMPLHVLCEVQSPKARQNNLTKATALWQQAQIHVDNNSESDLVRCCRQIVLLLEPTDSLYIMSRNVLAELAYDHEDMNEIYRHYAYFRFLDKKQPSGNYHDLCKRLKFRYDSLVIEDRKRPITDGIYVTALESPSRKYGPYAIMRISCYGDSWRGNLLGGELLKDNNVEKSKTDFVQEILQAPDEGDGSAPEFSVMWNKFAKRDPNISLSKSILTASNNFGRNMAGELNSGRYKTSDVVTGSLATGAVQGIFNGIAGLLARGSSQYYNTELIWTPNNGGQLAGRMIVSKVSQKTTESSAREEVSDFQVFLIKMYPHSEAFFIDDKANNIYFANGITGNNPKKDDRLAWELKTHPLIFNEEIAPLLGIECPINLERLKKDKRFPHLMFMLFIRQGAFPHMSTDSVAQKIAPFNQCYTDYGYGVLRYQSIDGKGAKATLTRLNGIETFEYLPDEDNEIGQISGYNDNGYRFVVQGTNKDGYTADIAYGDGFTYSGGVNHRNGDRHGQGILKNSNGEIWNGTFNSDYFFKGDYITNTDSTIVTIKYDNYEPDSIVTVNFRNGDVYVGPVNSVKQPHGKGMFTPKGKKPKETNWVDGTMITENRYSMSNKNGRRGTTSKRKKRS